MFGQMELPIGCEGVGMAKLLTAGKGRPPSMKPQATPVACPMFGKWVEGRIAEMRLELGIETPKGVRNG